MGTLDRPTAGRVCLAGRELSKLSEAQLAGVRSNQIGFVFQQFFLVEHLDAVANVALGLLYRGCQTRQRNRAAAAALERVGLGHRLSHRPNALSGGERQRIAIARALVGQPRMILADEPTGNLDSTSAAELLALLGEISADGTTIVVVSHDPSVAAATHRQITLHDGTVVAEDRPR
jgi:putative ABC transport system ATP-binding protein